MAPLVISGGGLAGYSLAREFRKLDKETPLLIITSDVGNAYSKPMLSNALIKDKTAQDLVTATTEQMGQELDAEIRNFEQVTAFNGEAHTFNIGSEVIRYSKLVLAVGAEPIRPLIDGDVDEILSVNELEDYKRFRGRFERKERIAIIGGGMSGCEFANDLSNAGYQVCVIDRNPQPLSYLMPEVIGLELNLALQRWGVEWHSQDEVRQVIRNGDGVELLLQSGFRVNTDVVLAADAGLDVNRGILVDRYLQSSFKDVYALGDCAEVNGAVLPFVTPLMIGARALAKTLVGTPTAVEYPPMPVTLKTPAYPLSILPPPSGVEGEWQIEQTADAITAVYRDSDGQLRGFALSGKAVKQAAVLTKSVFVSTCEPVLAAFGNTIEWTYG